MEKLEFKGTKGGWEVTQMLNVVSSENSKMICATQSNMDGHEIEANVKLIAASPNLLEACEKAYEICSKVQFPTEQELNELKLYIESVIQKAIG